MISWCGRKKVSNHYWLTWEEKRSVTINGWRGRKNASGHGWLIWEWKKSVSMIGWDGRKKDQWPWLVDVGGKRPVAMVGWYGRKKRLMTMTGCCWREKLSVTMIGWCGKGKNQWPWLVDVGGEKVSDYDWLVWEGNNEQTSFLLRDQIAACIPLLLGWHNQLLILQNFFSCWVI